MKSAFLLALLSASAYTLATGNFTFPLTEVKGTGPAYLKGAADAGRARAESLQGNVLKLVPSALTPAGPHRQLAISVGVGKPVLTQQLLFDTGSAITWFKHYTPSATSHYLAGEKIRFLRAWNGNHALGDGYLDNVTINALQELVIKDQEVMSAKWTHGDDWAQGALGLGPTELTRGSSRPNAEKLIPTVMDNLFAQQKISEKLFGVFIPPQPAGGWLEGSVTFGGVDPSSIVGELTYVPGTTTLPSANYWGIDINSCTFGDGTDAHTIITKPVSGILDSSTPLIYLSEDYFDAYMKAIPGASFDHHTGLLMLSRHRRTKKMKPLHFNIGGRTFTLDADAQLIPPQDNEKWGGRKRKRYSYISSMGSKSNKGLDFVLGLPFLTRFYTVYSTDPATGKRQIGIAETKYTYSQPSN